MSDQREALAESWASIDGKLREFRRGRAAAKAGDNRLDAGDDGHYEGYLADADEMILRLRKRGYCIVAEPPKGDDA